MNDVERAGRDAGEGRHLRDGKRLGGHRSCDGDRLHRGGALVSEPLSLMLDDGSVLSVDVDEQARSGGCGQNAEDGAVGHLQTGDGHEDLHARRVELSESWDLLEYLVSRVGDERVESEVDVASTLREALLTRQRIGERPSLVLERVIEV